MKFWPAETFVVAVLDRSLKRYSNLVSIGLVITGMKHTTSTTTNWLL